MSAGLVTVNRGFRWLRARGAVPFWAGALIWMAVGGLGHGAAMKIMDERAVYFFFVFSAGALTWPVLVDTGLSRLKGTLAAIVFSGLLWWTHWVGWHLAEAGRDPGPFRNVAWLQEPRPGADPFAFDGRRAVEGAMAFALLPPSSWRGYFHDLSERVEIKQPPRRPGYRSRGNLSPERLRRIWTYEPLVFFVVQLIAVWPRKTALLLNFLSWLSPRYWRRRQ
ncbi:MAG: hypothetical protein AAF577_01135 [Pseudomonadota bacterium]